MYKFFVYLSLMTVGTLTAPVKDELMFEGPGDTATVESTVREARAAPSHIGDLIKPGVKDAFLYVYGDAENDDGDLHGYSKKMNDKGKDGYRHFDSFHKKDGDKYGYEKHSAYGQENKADIDGENTKGIELAHLEAEGGKKDDGKAESRKSYAVLEEFDEEDKKQPKKKAESDYTFFGEGDGAGGSYESSEGDDDGEGSESSDSESYDNDKGEGDAETEEDAEEEGEDEEY